MPAVWRPCWPVSKRPRTRGAAAAASRDHRHDAAPGADDEVALRAGAALIDVRLDGCVADMRAAGRVGRKHAVDAAGDHLIRALREDERMVILQLRRFDDA